MKELNIKKLRIGIKNILDNNIKLICKYPKTTTQDVADAIVLYIIESKGKELK